MRHFCNNISIHKRHWPLLRWTLILTTNWLNGFSLYSHSLLKWRVCFFFIRRLSCRLLNAHLHDAINKSTKINPTREKYYSGDWVSVTYVSMVNILFLSTVRYSTFLSAVCVFFWEIFHIFMWLQHMCVLFSVNCLCIEHVQL